jgi:hypothetical protein
MHFCARWVESFSLVQKLHSIIGFSGIDQLLGVLAHASYFIADGRALLAESK